MLIKLAKFSSKQQEYIKDVLREEERPGMSNAAKGALWGTLALPLVGTGIGYHLGNISDQKKDYRIDKLHGALKHNDVDSVKDVINQDRHELHRTVKGFLWAGVPGAIAGHISQEKKDERNRILRHVVGDPV